MSVIDNALLASCSISPIQCKCSSTMCRKGWDHAIRFESVEQAYAAGWQVSGTWPRHHFLCPEHRAAWLANVRKIARSEPLGDLLEIA
jgi:hypothetical protein